MLKRNRTLLYLPSVAFILLLCICLTIGCSTKSEGNENNKTENVENGKTETAETIEESEMTLSFGTEKAIELQTLLESPVWVSADETIASVNADGIVKGLAPGTTVITAKVNDKPVATVNVTVTIADIEVTVNYGMEKTIEPIGIGTFTWVSSDDTIASVDDVGVVKGIAPGNAVISVSQNNIIVAKVTVTVQVIEPTAIFLNLENVEIEIDSSATLTYMLMPDNASDYGITWRSTNPGIATVDDTGKVQGVTDGTATIICSTLNGQLATCSVTVKSKSAIEQLNEAEKALFDGLINDILPLAYNASAFRIRKLYYMDGSKDNTLLYADIQGTNRLGGTLYQTGAIFQSVDKEKWYYLEMDINKNYPVPENVMDYTKINAALDEYWRESFH